MNIVTTNNHTAEWVWAILSIAYVLSPVDAIPDVPIIGWVDDFFVASVAGLNRTSLCFRYQPKSSPSAKAHKMDTYHLRSYRHFISITFGNSVKLFTN